MNLTSYYFKLNRMRERERDNLLGTFSSHLNVMADGLHVSDDMRSNHVPNISSPDQGGKKKNNNTPVPISQPSRTYSVNFFPICFLFLFLWKKRKSLFVPPVTARHHSLLLFSPLSSCCCAIILKNIRDVIPCD